VGCVKLKNQKNSLKSSKISEYDVSLIRDLAYAVRNMIEAEGHLKQTIATIRDREKKKKYIEILKTVRTIRGKWMNKILKNKDYGIYCFSKHALSVSEELGEVASKLADDEKDEESYEAMEDAEKFLVLVVTIHSPEFLGARVENIKSEQK
jgi:hypothetical protein